MPGRWFDEKFSKDKKSEDGDLKRRAPVGTRARRRDPRQMPGQTGVVEEESKPTTQLSPLLYDLTSLQREANGRFGFSAKTTLSIAQALYEKHKVLTYPRTDARALPEDYLATVNGSDAGARQARISRSSSRSSPRLGAPEQAHFQQRQNFRTTLRSFRLRLRPKHLSEAEAKIYDLVTKRFLAVFFPAAEFQITTRITRVEGEPFKSEGKIMVNAGWLEIYGKEAETDDTPALVPVRRSEKPRAPRRNRRLRRCKPSRRRATPKRRCCRRWRARASWSMTRNCARRCARKGLGTPATRAAIIEGLIYEKYVHRNGRELQPTAKAFSLITLLRGLKIDELFSPELTGDWEYQLAQMEQGKLKRDQFMQQIADMTRHIVERAKEHESDTVPGDFSTLADAVPEMRRRGQGKLQEIPVPEMRLRAVEDPRRPPARAGGGRRTDHQAQHRSAAGFPQPHGQAVHRGAQAEPEFKTEFDFGQNGNEADAEPVDFSGQQPLGACPKCGGRVFSHGVAYLCEKAVGPDRTCDFRSGKIILQRPIEPEQMQALLATGKTDLLHRFISKKGRPFSAFLARGDDGKVTFEFAPREPAKASKNAPAKTSKAARRLIRRRDCARPSALVSMNARRGSTRSPINVVKISSADIASSIWARSSRRTFGSMVVSHNCAGFISPNPL